MYQSLYKAQADYRRHGDEIAVIVKEEEVVFQGYLCNEAVDCAPNSDSLFAAGKIDAGGPGVRFHWVLGVKKPLGGKIFKPFIGSGFTENLSSYFVSSERSCTDSALQIS